MTEPQTSTLRPYQREALQAIDEHVARGSRRLVIVLPTGCGKGYLTAHLPNRLGTPLLLLTHREELLEQHAAQMRRANPTLSIGVEQADRQASGDEQIVLASIPTLIAAGKRRLQRFLTIPWTAVVIDEVHHAPAQTWSDAIKQLGCLNEHGPVLIGATATPQRGDGIGLHELFQEIAYQKGLREMIDAGYCCALRGHAIHTNVRLDHVHVQRGDFAEGSLANAVNTRSRNTLIVEAWRRLAERRRTLVFSTNVLHAEALALSFQRAGIKSRAISGRLDRRVRTEHLDAFRKGDVTVLVNCNLLTEGYDDPPLSCLVLARPTTSSLLYQQMLGRATRIFPDKTDGLILDVVDVSKAHRIQTAASLFGLPATIDLKGRSITKTADQVETTLGRHPQLQPEQFATIDQLLAEAERLTLDIRPIDLVPYLAPEVLREARLTWITLPSADYAIPLAGPTQIRVHENLLSQWEVMLFPERTILSTHATRVEAFAAAEHEIAQRDRDRWRLAKHHAPWRRQPPSESQQRLIQTLGLTLPATRGEASQLIDQLRVQRQAGLNNQPPTARQHWFLIQHSAWRDTMTKAEAGLAIRDIKQRLSATPLHETTS